MMDLVKIQILATALAKAEAAAEKLRKQRDAGIRELAENPTYTVQDIARYAGMSGPRVSQIVRPPAKKAVKTNAISMGDQGVAAEG